MASPSPTLFRRVEPDAVAAEIVRFFFAVDGSSGHLYPTSEVTDILPRVDAGTGNLHLNDDTALAAARTAIVGGTRGVIY
jgi:hypothetical protein